MDNQPIILERVFNAPIDKVWNALTNNEEMKIWYFQLPEFIPVIGFEFRFIGGPTADRQYQHICKITAVESKKKLAHSWRYDGYDGISFVTWELWDEDSTTRLRLTHNGLETFPHSNQDFAKENFEIGWASILDSSLGNYLST